MELTHFTPFAVSGFCSGPGAAKAVEKQGNPSLTCMEPVGSRERLLPQPRQGVLELHRGRGAGCGVWGAAGMSIRLLPFPTCRKGRHWNTGTHRGILHEDIPAWNEGSPTPRPTPAAPAVPGQTFLCSWSTCSPALSAGHPLEPPEHPKTRHGQAHRVCFGSISQLIPISFPSVSEPGVVPLTLPGLTSSCQSCHLSTPLLSLLNFTPLLQLLFLSPPWGIPPPLPSAPETVSHPGSSPSPPFLTQAVPAPNKSLKLWNQSVAFHQNVVPSPPPFNFLLPLHTSHCPCWELSLCSTTGTPWRTTHKSHSCHRNLPGLDREGFTA